MSSSGLWLPAGAAQQVNDSQVESAIHQFVDVVRLGLGEIVAPRTLDGARTTCAAAHLARGVVLLEEGLSHPDANHLGELGLRSIVELAITGRYLLVCPAAEDEFIRGLADLVQREKNHAKHLNTSAPGLPAFLAQHVPADGDYKGRRDLYSLADGLDIADGFDGTELHSARQSYRTIYAPLSDSAVHASMQSMKRAVLVTDGMLKVDPKPGPILTGKPVIVAAGRLGDLALDVWREFSLDDEPLRATGVRSRE